MRNFYLFLLLLSLSCLARIDQRYKLAFYKDWRRALKTLAAGLGIFLLWDLFGIQLDIFYIGTSQYLTGIRIWHEVPLEETIFLLLLMYTALILWRMMEEKWPRI